MQNVCEGVKCEGAGECVPLTNGVCLTLYSPLRSRVMASFAYFEGHALQTLQTPV